MTNLISDVSDIKEKQERLQSSLDCHQKGLQTTELQQPRRDPNTSFSGPFVTPSKSSTPMERKAWYMTDSFAEQFSPPGSSCARSAFEIGYPQQQQREALGKSTVPELPEKRLPLSDLPLPPPQQQSDTVQAATPATCGPKCGDGENTDPGLSVKAGATDDQQVLPIPLDSDVIMKIRYVSSSRRNFSANLNRKLFTMAERKASNVNGALGKCKLDPAKIEYIKRVTFRMYPLNSKESEAVEWGNSVSAIDEVNRRLNTTKNRKSKK